MIDAKRNLPRIVLHWSLALLVLTGLSSCISPSNNLHDRTLRKTPLLKNGQKAKPGTLYQLSSRSDYSWCYQTRTTGATILWSSLTSANLPSPSVESSVWSESLSKDCQNWQQGSLRVNGWPNHSRVLGKTIFIGEIESPIFEWETIENSKSHYDYVTAIPIGKSSVCAQLRVTRTDESGEPMTLGEVNQALHELLASEAWKKLHLKE